MLSLLLFEVLQSGIGGVRSATSERFQGLFWRYSEHGEEGSMVIALSRTLL